jgi:hypothetical protein
MTNMSGKRRVKSKRRRKSKPLNLFDVLPDIEPGSPFAYQAAQLRRQIERGDDFMASYASWVALHADAEAEIDYDGDEAADAAGDTDDADFEKVQGNPYYGMALFCQEAGVRLDAWKRDFLDGIVFWIQMNRPLQPLQIEKLEEIVAHVQAKLKRKRGKRRQRRV